MRRVAQGDADERGRVLLDGLHLVQEARAAGLPLSTAAFTTKLLNAPDGAARRLATSLAGLGCRVAQVSDAVMEAMSPASTPSGVVALDRPSAPRARRDAPAGREKPVPVRGRRRSGSRKRGRHRPRRRGGRRGRGDRHREQRGSLRLESAARRDGERLQAADRARAGSRSGARGAARGRRPRARHRPGRGREWRGHSAAARSPTSR